MSKVIQGQGQILGHPTAEHLPQVSDVLDSDSDSDLKKANPDSD